MANYRLICDIYRCSGCYNCFMSCKDEYIGNNHFPLSAAQKEGQSWLRLVEEEAGSRDKIRVTYTPVMCQHCEDAPCLKVTAPEGAVYRRDDGIVIIDPEKAKGIKDLIEACPYHAIVWNDDLQLPQKCTMCAHMLDAGEKVPRCVESCPSDALIFGDLDDPESAVSRFMAEHEGEIEEFKPKFHSTPHVLYKNLPKLFVTGEIVLEDLDVCAKDICVTVTSEETGETFTGKTDYLGDFFIDRLTGNTNYVLRAEQEGYVPAEVCFKSNASKNLGDIVLKKA